MGLSRTASEIDGDFNRKSQNFPTPCILCPFEGGVSLGIGYRRWGSKKTRMTEKFDDSFSRVDRMHQRDGGTDGRTDRKTDRRTPGDSRDRAYA